MTKTNNLIFALNAGEVSRYTLARIDLAKMRLTASTMKNWLAKVVGPMQFRGGTIFKTGTASNQWARLLPFIFSAEDAAQLELSDSTFRPLITGMPVSRPAVSTAVTNGAFASSVGWTLAASSGAAATIASNQLTLDTLVRGSTATARQQVTVAGGDQGVEHALRIVVSLGPVLFRVGSTNGGDEYIHETEIGEGTHSLAFTPTGSFWIQFGGQGAASRVVTSIAVEGAGTLTLPTPYLEDDLRSVRFDQSADVIFAFHRGYSPKRFERRGTHSWSVVRHPVNDGPFSVGRTARVKLQPGAIVGITTLTSDLPFFAASHVGSLFRLFHQGVKQTVTLGGEGQWSEVLRVSGVDSENDFFLAITGTWAGTLTLQRSIDGPDSGFNTVADYGANTSGQQASGAEVDNVIQYWRLGFRPGKYTSGTATVTLAYSAATGGNNGTAGGGAGICRVLGYTSPTQVTVEVVRPFFNTNLTDDWSEGLWSTRNGWPSAGVLHEGRLWAVNSDKLAGSVSDGFNSFDADVEGDSGPIVRSIATGPVNRGLWGLSLGRLIIGTSGAESVPRSSSFDEPMTPTNFSIKDASTQGSADVQAVKIDRNGIYVQRSGRRMYELAFESAAMDYVSSDITRFNPAIAGLGVKELAVQRQPDTRVWAVRSDGQAAILLYEKAEDVACWQRFVTDGQVVSVCVTPNQQQDDVWMVVKRIVGGADKYYVERMSYDENAIGGMVNEQADCAVIYGAVGSATLTGLDHLEGRTVVAWADGKPIDTDTFTVTGGRITLPNIVTTGAVVGLTYDGDWISTKLAYSAQMGTAIAQVKRIDQLAPIMVDTHCRGPRFGEVDAPFMDPVPDTIEGRRLGHDEVFSEYDAVSFPLSGEWKTDARLRVTCQAPFPCTILGFVVGVGTHDKG